MDFGTFKLVVRDTFNFDLNAYKEPQLKRRVDGYLAAKGYSSYDRYLAHLKETPGEWQCLIDRITINVSEFFRNPEIFGQLENIILPQLMAEKKPVKAWSAACSNGAEPYSLAMLFLERYPGLAHRIEATDIDQQVLAQAAEGLYREETIRNISLERKKNFFKHFGNSWVIKPEVKKLVHFRRHDLLRDSYGTGYNLIICRNVTIYFTREIQDRIYQNFYKALHLGGVLFIGATESIWGHRELGFDRIAPWFYRKVQPGQEIK